MKLVIACLMLLATIKSNGQSNSKIYIDSISASGNLKSGALLSGITQFTGYDFGYRTDANLVLKTKYDSTILFEGDKKCVHTWATKDVRNGMFSGSIISCAVYHGITGCPDNWSNVNVICTKCFRHFNVKETRWTEKKLDEYDEAVERFNKLHPKKP